MATTLKSYLSGTWQAGSGAPARLVNPSTEEVLAEATTGGLNLGAALEHARRSGGPALRAMTFVQRAGILRKLAKGISDAREELIKLGLSNAGNTRSDAKFDIDGAAATLMFYAELGEGLGERRWLADGEGIALGRSARLYGQHVWVPRRGVAVHVNAFNFPAWGMAEKLGPAILAGMPVLSKPATATAMMAHRIAELWIASAAIPEGAFSFMCGGAGDLLSHLSGQDALAFTGSGETAASIRRTERVAAANVHVNVEADSLNAAVLGPDAGAGSETFGLFVGDVVREITQKAGQKCTATRRVLVPAELLGEARDALLERLKDFKPGNPADERVNLGPLATAQQLADVRAGMTRLSQRSKCLLGGPETVEGLGAPAGKGYFVSPTLYETTDGQSDHPAHAHEVFGPVATLMPYKDVADLGTLVAAGGGGLVASVYSDDRAFLEPALAEIAPYHGRICISGEKLAGQTVSPGTVMPQLLHGGPGRAGSGEELGGMRGMSLYLQRLALQGHRALIEQLVK